MLRRLLLSGFLGVCAALLSTFVGERSALATYPDIMGCEIECRVVATGWPLVFVRDYTGMSVVGTADLAEVIFAADRFDWAPFVANAAIWGVLFFTAASLLQRFGAARAG